MKYLIKFKVYVNVKNEDEAEKIARKIMYNKFEKEVEDKIIDIKYDEGLKNQIFRLDK